MTSSYVFTLLLLFASLDDKPPVFGNRVEARVTTESQDACQRFQKVLASELKGYRVRHEITPCQVAPTARSLHRMEP